MKGGSMLTRFPGVESRGWHSSVRGGCLFQIWDLDGWLPGRSEGSADRSLHISIEGTILSGSGLWFSWPLPTGIIVSFYLFVSVLGTCLPPGLFVQPCLLGLVFQPSGSVSVGVPTSKVLTCTISAIPSFFSKLYRLTCFKKMEIVYSGYCFSHIYSDEVEICINSCKRLVYTIDLFYW